MQFSMRKSSTRKDREGLAILDVEVKFEDSLQCRNIPIEILDKTGAITGIEFTYNVLPSIPQPTPAVESGSSAPEP